MFEYNEELKLNYSFYVVEDVENACVSLLLGLIDLFGDKVKIKLNERKYKVFR